MNIQDLVIYPIKSCAGIALQSTKLDRFGPKHDRRWMLIDDQGVQITQRDDARLALIRPRLLEHGLSIEYQGESVEIAIPVNGQPHAVQVWADTVQGLDAGSDAAQWFTAILGRSTRLVWMPDSWQRSVEKPFAQNGETVSFADAYPLLLISQASLDDLNSKLSTPVPMNRFRPNIVVSGCEAFAEDSWSNVTIGELEFQVAKACSRCVMPSIDQQTADKDSEILKVMASYRRGSDGRTYFGQNLLYQSFATLEDGEEVVAQKR